MRLATSSRNGLTSPSTILNGAPSWALLEVAWSEVRSFQLLLAELGQRMQTAAEQRSHLLGGHRVAGGQAVDPVHAGTDPHPRRLTPFGVVGRQPGVTFLGRVQRRDLPGQVVIPGPAVSLWTLIVTPTRRGYMPPGGQADPSYFRRWASMLQALWGMYPRCVRCLGGTSGGTLLRGGCGRTPQRRAEFEAGSFATQLAFRQSVVPHLRRPHPLWPRSARPAGEAGWSERRHLQRRDAWW